LGALSVYANWVSANITAPLTTIVVNGVVSATSGPPNAPATLYALKRHGENAVGKRQGDQRTAFGTVYAFGFAMERK
jgi:pilus assembly protein TadC